MSLCYTSDELHDTENALKYADMCGSIYSSREGLRAFVTDGEDGVRATQEYLIALIQSAVYTATNMMNKSVTTDDELLTALDFGLSLLKLLFPDERFGYMANDMSILCIWKAGIYASRKDREKTLSALAESVSYAIEGSEVGENFRFTAPLVNRVGYNPKLSSKNYKGNACDLRLEELDRALILSVRTRNSRALSSV